jgi:hypothetical protein
VLCLMSIFSVPWYCVVSSVGGWLLRAPCLFIVMFEHYSFLRCSLNAVSVDIYLQTIVC